MTRGWRGTTIHMRTPDPLYRADIDGLRALAVIPVILFHAGFKWVSGGYVGVDVFFVISGYLITGILLRGLRENTFSFWAFYERRARRILPALYFVMLVCVPFAWLLMTPAELVGFSHSLVAVSTFSSNMLFWSTSGYFDPSGQQNVLLHTWSLAIEEQFYVLFPIAMVVFWRFRRKWLATVFAATAIGSFALNQYNLVHHHVNVNYYVMPTRAWELLVGALVACAFRGEPAATRSDYDRWRNEAMSVLGLSLVLGSVFFYGQFTPYPSAYTLAPTLGAALMLAFCSRETRVARLLSLPFVVGMGLISYSAYLWHQPLFAFARIYSLRHPSPVVMMSLSAASIGLAFVTWRFIEQPFRQRGRWSRRQVTPIFLLGAVGFIGLGVVGASHKGALSPNTEFQFDSRNSELTRGYAAARGRDCDLKGFPSSLSQTCRILGAAVTPTVVLMGDSHAEMLQGPMSESLSARGLAAYSFVMPMCPPIRNVARNSEGFEQCLQLNRWISDNILYSTRVIAIDSVIAVTRWTEMWCGCGFDNLEGGVDDVYALTGLGLTMTAVVDGRETVDKAVIRRLVVDHFKSIAIRQTILVYPVPEAGWHVPEYFTKIRMRGVVPSTGSISHDAVVKRHAEMNALLDSLPGHIIRVKPESLLCNTFVQGRCVTQVNKTLLYLDTNHLTYEGAKIVVAEIAQHLGRGPNRSAGSWR